MADAEFKFESAEWDRVIKRIRRKWDDIRNRKEFAGIVSIAAYKNIEQHFKDQSGPDGKWQKWSTAYEEHRKKIGRYKKGKILILSAKLKNSITPESGKFRSNSSGVLLYSALPYAHRHDEGTDGMPQRKFMWVSDKAIDSILDQTLKWLNED